MNWLVYHIVSGQSFFSGGVLIVASVLAANSTQRRIRRASILGFLLGAIIVAFSSTPLPYWGYGIIGVTTVVWIISQCTTSKRQPGSYTLAVMFIVAMAWEATFHFLPASMSSVVGRPALTIIGDSVTAGLGENEAETWPFILWRTHAGDVHDSSHVGETASSALQRISDKPLSPLVLIEIGGNDVLGSTTSAQFENDLEALLDYLAQDNRQVLMFELPLPPFYNEFGRIQRRLASRYGVLLIPKRYFLDVLAGDASTLDTIHLSQKGHQQMAETVWQIVEPMYR
ncbi:MAG: GDSL-type esterase/lipase family protein, partial [Planctomycetota bacterium]|nr:GDSL-type esterase/lipase family protein [Planctomycetota bacterium]